MELLIVIIGGLLALFGFKGFRSFQQKREDDKFKKDTQKSMQALAELAKSLTAGEERAKILKEEITQNQESTVEEPKESVENFFDNRYTDKH